MTLKSITKSLCAASAVCLGLAAVPAHAALIVDGDVTFTFTIIDSDTLTLRIEGLDSTTGQWSTAEDFKGIGIHLDSFSAGSTISIGGQTESLSNNELDANDPICGGGGGPDQFCAVFDPLVAITDDMLFTIELGDPMTGDPDAIHLKIHLLDDEGEFDGSLLSQDVPLNGNGTSEPGILGLFGLGLLLLGFMRRRTVG